MELLIASNNGNKLREIREILGERFDAIYSLRDKGIEIDVEETGETFAENALIKAKAVSEIAGGAITLSDDSGLCVKALGGAPGVYSARYAGEECDSEKNNAKLLAALEGESDRRANFVSVVCLYYPDGRAVFGEGSCDGEITSAYSGGNGFGYDPIFYSYDLNMTFGEACGEEKNRVSHRARALRDLLEKM